MKYVDAVISLHELDTMAKRLFGGLVKAVVDIEKQVMVVDAALHADEEEDLLSRGSVQGNLWGINLYPELYGTADFIEFDSMINIRPSQNNVSRTVQDEQIKKKIRDIIQQRVSP